MNSFSTLLPLLGLCSLLCGGMNAGADAVNFTGHYELADAKTDREFSLDITQTGSKVDVSFSAAMTDGSSAAPDGDGHGGIDTAGVLKFVFKDSFENEGKGTLSHDKTGYHLEMETTKVVEPRPLRFYGKILLKKTANKPASS